MFDLLSVVGANKKAPLATNARRAHKKSPVAAGAMRLGSCSTLLTYILSGIPRFEILIFGYTFFGVTFFTLSLLLYTENGKDNF